MQPWRISVGLSAALVGSGLLLGGSRLEFLAPLWPVILAEHGIPIVLHSALPLGALAAATYAVAHAAGLADLGRRVDLLERRYGGKTPAVALEACAAELETALRQRDDTILTLTEAAGGKAATPPLTWDAWSPRARSRTPQGPAHPGSLEGTSPMRPGALAESRPGGEAFPARGFHRADRAVHHRGGYRMMAQKRSPPQLQRRRAGPEPGAGLSRPQDRSHPDRVAGRRDGGLPSRSGIATGTGPRGRRTPVAAGRVQPLTPVELRPLPSAPALQIPELLPSPALQSASSADAPRPAARPPLPLLVSFRPLREAQLAPAQPRRFPRSPRRAGSRSRAGVRPGASRSAPGASAAPAPSGSPSLARAQTLPLRRLILGPVYSHMDAIWTPQRVSSPYTAIDLAVKYLLFMHLLQCPRQGLEPRTY